MSNVSNDSSQGFSKPQTVRVEDTCKWKEAIDPLKLLYPLVDPVEGKGAEFPVQKCTVKGNRQLRRGSCHCCPQGPGLGTQAPKGISSSAFFTLRTVEPSPRVSDASHLACPRLDISTLHLLFLQDLLSQFLASHTHMQA